MKINVFVINCLIALGISSAAVAKEPVRGGIPEAFKMQMQKNGTALTSSTGKLANLWAFGEYAQNTFNISDATWYKDSTKQINPACAVPSIGVLDVNDNVENKKRVFAALMLAVSEDRDITLVSDRCSTAGFAIIDYVSVANP